VPDGHDYDVIVLGGGPGGSLFASLCRRQDPDRSVLVLERAKFPRHHVGESCSPGWAPILERAGVLQKLHASDVIRKAGVLFHWGEAEGQTWTADFRDRSGHGVRAGSFQVDRAQFDHLLLENARELGAEVREEVTVRGVERLPEGGFRVHFHDVRGTPGSSTASYLIDASGQARLLARFFTLPVVPYDDMNNYAVFGYWKGSKIAAFDGPLIHERERWTYIAAAPDGWLWHIPTAPDLVSVGLVTDAETLRSLEGSGAIEALYLRNVRAAERVRDLLTDATLVQHPLAPSVLMTARDWAYHVEQTCGPGFFLVGDAAAFIDPILSSGLTITAHGAALAANAMHSIWNDPELDVELLRESYTQAYQDMASTYHRLARIWYSRNFKCDTWHWEAKRQRLRTGRHPADETADEAFLEQCMGTFANPIEGSFGVADFEDRGGAQPTGQVIRDHLFPRPQGAADGPAKHERAREALDASALARFRELLPARVSLRGAAYREAESYFTDRHTERWRRVRYAEITDAHTRDRFERVVFPADNVVSLLAESSLAQAARRFCGNTEPGSSAHHTRARLAQSQILQLDLLGLLAIEPKDDQRPLDWPAPLLAIAQQPLVVSTDLLGESIEVVVGQDRVVLTAMPSRARHRPFASTATTAFAYRGGGADARPMVERLVSAYRVWEAQQPEAARAFWSRSFLLAGLATSLGPTPR
jgi:flavin-dependent dehydrogenase